MTVPLDKQVFAVKTNYEKEQSGQTITGAEADRQSILNKYKLPIVVATAVLGLASVIYGSRKQIFKTPYRRELEKIYRYNEGIIIRTSRQPDFSHKSLVGVKSFDDMINLNEELKTPIIALTEGPETTRFVAIQGDVVYYYLLGKYRPDENRELQQIQNSLVSRQAPVAEAKTKVVAKPKPKTNRKKIK